MGHDRVCFKSDMFRTGTRREAKWLYLQQKKDPENKFCGDIIKGQGMVATYKEDQ